MMSLFLMLNAQNSDPLIYVATDGSDSDGGTTWATAFLTVNKAMTALKAKVRITPPGPATLTALPTPRKTPAPIIIPTLIMVI